MATKDPRLAIHLPGLNLKNPVMPASGCFAFGDNSFAYAYDLNHLGAIIIKSTTQQPRLGNPQPQITKTDCGVMNAVGLTNPGVDVVVSQKLPDLKRRYPNLPVIGNVAGSSLQEYVYVAKKLAASGLVEALEINISCPNVKAGGMHFGVDAKSAAEVTKAIKQAVGDLPIYIKLSPNVADPTPIAKAVVAAGADGLSMINTLLALKLDPKTGQAKLGNGTGGLSGRAIHPLAVRMVKQVSDAVDVPIIALGGIETADDVIEMYQAGASAVAIGSAHFKDAKACLHIAQALPEKLDELGIESLEALRAEVKARKQRSND